MAKKRFRPRSGGGGRGGYGGGGDGYGGGGGGGGGGYGRGGRGGGGGGGMRRRPRRLDGPPMRRPYAAGDHPEGEPPPEGAFVEGEEGQLEGGALTAVEPQLDPGCGMLEMHPNGYGFLRSPENNYSRERTDPFVPGTMIERYSLRQGVMIKGLVQQPRKQQGPRVREITDVDGLAPDDYMKVKSFDQLTPVNPDKWYQLETGPQPLTTRVMDLLTPLGRGQRALIVAPPRSGKTIMLQHIAHGIATNYPDTKLMVLLIDERPEEVTDMQRNVKGEVVASSLDMDVESHVRLSQLVIERCRRLAEMGKDVFLLMDSITRLARAFNKWVGNTGRTMSGGVDIKAMDIPKKLFATARAFEEGGSLTVVGTALVETGSRMDDLIFQEFKGTGNMELVLDRRLADRRVWPAIDISQSGTRREELLLSAETLHAVTMLRRTLNSMNPVDAMEQLTKQLGRFKTNAEFLQLIKGKADND
jgi:transcription termination factor Rho